MTQSEKLPDVVQRARQALDGIETPTPWVAKWCGVYGTSGPKSTYYGTDGSPSLATAEGGFVEGEFLEGDAEFIAAAPDLVRDLLALVEVALPTVTAQRDDALTEVEKLQSEVAELRLSRAELADEAQTLRNWRDGDRDRAERDELRAEVAGWEAVAEDNADTISKLDAEVEKQRAAIMRTIAACVEADVESIAFNGEPGVIKTTTIRSALNGGSDEH